MARNPSRKVKDYWRQVRAVQALTGASSGTARRAVALIRSERGYRTAAETKRHPVVTARLTKAVAARPVSQPPGPSTTGGRRGGRRQEPQEPPEAPPISKPYRSLDDWVEAWEEWEGDYDYYEIETAVDYEA
jgi:hypothetical protein